MVIKYRDKAHPIDWDISANCINFIALLFFCFKTCGISLNYSGCNALIRFIYQVFFKVLYAVIYYVRIAR